MLPRFGQAQFPYIDSIKQVVNQTTDPRQQLEQLLVLLKHSNSLHGDSMLRYIRKANTLAGQLKDKKSARIAAYFTESAAMKMGKTDSVVYRLENHPLLRLGKKEDTALYYKVQLLKANALNRLNKRTEALELQLRLLKEAEAEQRWLEVVYCLNYTGATYYNLSKPYETNAYWQRGLQIAAQHPSPAMKEIEVTLYSNLVLYYGYQFGMQKSKQMADSLEYFLQKTIDESRRYHVYWVLAGALSGRGAYYGSMGKTEQAENDFREAIDIRSKIGDPLYIINDLLNLASFYYTGKRYTDCINTVQSVMELAKQGHITENKTQCFMLLSASYKALGDDRNYSKALERFIADSDTAYRLNAADRIAEIEARYKLEKINSELAEQKYELFRRKILLIGAGALGLLLFLYFFIRFRSYKKQQRLRMTRMMEEKKREEEQAVKDAEEKERKRIAAELHDNLGVQANAILHNTSLLQQTAAPDQAVVTDLQETAREMLLNLRETLWALKAADAPATDLWLRAISFVKQMGRHYTTLRFSVEGSAPSGLQVPSARALNILLMIQEAVNNAVKHAAASQIVLRGEVNQDNWVITVSDDGCGFDPSQMMNKEDGYGLKNMQSRAVDSAIDFTVNSQPGRGSSVILKTGLN